MISALSGAGSRALLSLFGRPKSQGPAEDVSQVASRTAVAAPLPEARNAAASESLFAAMVEQNGAPADLASQALTALDRDGSGTLSSDELTQAYQAVTSSTNFASVTGLVSSIIKTVDGNGDGAISGNELASAVAGLASGRAPGGTAQDEGMQRLLDQVMAQLDTDGSNRLSRAEVAEALGMGGEGVSTADFGIAGRPEEAPKSMYEAIFSMRLNPSGGESSSDARAALAARLRDQLMG
jgi:hypothetical protein